MPRLLPFHVSVPPGENPDPLTVRVKAGLAYPMGRLLDELLE